MICLSIFVFFNLRTTLTWYCQPYVGTYGASANPADPLFDFTNRYITIHDPVYIAGYQQFFTQSREQFFGIYPNVNSIASIGSQGDGIETHFVGNIASTPMLQYEVLMTSVDINNVGLLLKDVPNVDPLSGLPLTTGTFAGNGFGTINYITGAFDITFAAAPKAGAAINSQCVPYVAALPQALLFYDGAFTLRPIPDQPYSINVEAYIRPTTIPQGGNLLPPDLDEWWQYIAYGAARKIFQDRLDMDSVALIEPEFKLQERLINRRTIVQYTKERTATIYTEQTQMGPGGYGWGWGSSNF